MSLDEELGILSIITPGARKIRHDVNTPASDRVVHRSTHVKYLANMLIW